MRKIENAIANLLKTNPFYAQFFLNCKVEYDKYNIPSAAAALTRKGITLVFNTDFIDKQTVSQVEGVVEHEILHVLFEHLQTWKDNTINKRLANVAMDCSINQYIDDLPKDCITLDGLSKSLGVVLSPRETWEYYYAQILKNMKKTEGMDSFDIHGLDLDPENKLTPEQKKVLVKTILDKAARAAAGNLPEAVAKVFDAFNAESKVSWQQVLSNFVARASTNTTRNTHKKSNRRFGLDQPGKLKKRELILAVCTDSSGSVSDESYTQFLSEIVRISSIAQKTYLIDVDCVVQNVEVVKKGKYLKKERHGSGGTAYQPAIDEAMKYRPDCIVYFGDFDCADVPTDPGIPFLWVGVGNSPKPGDFGYEIRL